MRALTPRHLSPARIPDACKTIDVKALRKTPDGPNIVGRLRNEIGIMSYLAGHPNVRGGEGGGGGGGGIT